MKSVAIGPTTMLAFSRVLPTPRLRIRRSRASASAATDGPRAIRFCQHQLNVEHITRLVQQQYPSVLPFHPSTRSLVDIYIRGPTSFGKSESVAPVGEHVAMLAGWGKELAYSTGQAWLSGTDLIRFRSLFGWYLTGCTEGKCACKPTHTSLIRSVVARDRMRLSALHQGPANLLTPK